MFPHRLHRLAAESPLHRIYLSRSAAFLVGGLLLTSHLATLANAGPCYEDCEENPCAGCCNPSCACDVCAEECFPCECHPCTTTCMSYDQCFYPCCRPPNDNWGSCYCYVETTRDVCVEYRNPLGSETWSDKRWAAHFSLCVSPAYQASGYDDQQPDVEWSVEPPMDLTRPGEQYKFRATQTINGCEFETIEYTINVVEQVDISFPALADEMEETPPGGLACVGDPKPLSIGGGWQPLHPASAYWKITWGSQQGGAVRLWRDENMTQEILNGQTFPWTGSFDPSMVYVEGTAPGGVRLEVSTADIGIPPGLSCSDSLYITIVRVSIGNGLPEEQKNVSPGLVIWPNGDDDDWNDEPDVDDAPLNIIPPATTLPEDDDLFAIDLSITPNPPGFSGPITLDVSGPISLWLDTSKVAACPSTFTPNQLPMRVWAEGLSAGEATITVHFAECKDSVKLTVIEVSSVVFTRYQDNWPLTVCPNNGGKRIFPDLLNYNDTANIGLRPWVQVEALIEPAIPNATVFFKAWDVDDPFDQNNPIAGVYVIDNDVSGPDNRGLPGQLSAPAASADGLGKATVQFKVGLRPGDNYKLYATTIPLLNPFTGRALNLPTQLDADALAPPPPRALPGGTWTEMLTVWRHLWGELDSMQAGGGLCASQSSLLFQYAIENLWSNAPHGGETEIDVDNADDEPAGVYEGGVLTTLASPGNLYTLFDNWPAGVDNGLFVTKDSVTPNVLAEYCEVCDDDLPFVPRVVDTSLLNQKLKPGYVEFNIAPGVSDYNLPFLMNFESTIENINLTYGQRDLTTSPWFWTIQYIAAHEPMVTEDSDPDIYYHIHSAAPGGYKDGGEITTLGESPQCDGNFSMVYLETIRDIASQADLAAFGFNIPATSFSGSESEQAVVAHELGHVFGCPHTMGLMEAGQNNPSEDFRPISLMEIRWSTCIEVP